MGGTTPYPTAPLSLEKWSVLNEPTNGGSCVKSYQAGGVKPYEETQTAKLIEKGDNGIDAQILG